MAKFDTEREGQIKFYETFIPRVDPDLDLDEILADDNDGVINGNLLEFKLIVTDLNAVLFQCIKYLSARRLKGKPVPASVVIVSLEESVAYVYCSKDYLEQIETVYNGPSSKNNSGFTAGKYADRLDYSDQLAAERLVKTLKTDNYTKTHIDENCIVGWAEEYYRLRPDARKEHFIGDSTGKHKVTGEIRQPKVFARYLIPYTGQTNVKFDYLMDCLNDFLQKKDLGAFFTPEPYAERARELLEEAISRVPSGNDYVIIDRCAGTGNLERGLSEDVLSHCIVSTKEYYEYKVLQELIGSKVRHIIPPIEAEDTFDAGNVRGADALTREYVENPIIRSYVDDPSCTIILFENPPFAETTSMEHQKRGEGKKSSSGWKASWVVEQMRKAAKEDPSISGTSTNDMGNVFIWSAFEYYLRQPTDSYVVFSPVKYWKAQGLVKKRFIDGFAGDRFHFHARKHSCVLVALWSNEDATVDSFTVDGFDIIKGKLGPAVPLDFRRIDSLYSSRYYDKRKMEDDIDGGILLQKTGDEATTQKKRLKPRWNKNILGYMVVDGFGFDNPDLHSILVSAGIFNGNGFYLRRDNYLQKLPMFAAPRYISYDGSWTERGRIMKSADGADRFLKDVTAGKLDQWLLRTLLFTCMEYQNHMRSFKGSDGRAYRNELCLDTTNRSTVASAALEGLQCGERENELLTAWTRVLEEAKETTLYDRSLTYGLYQIGEELNTWREPSNGKKGRIYDYPSLNGSIRALKELNKKYYLEEIVPKLLEYEFLK